MLRKKTAEIKIQERDLEILLGLFDCRVMTLHHIARLYFGGKSEAAKKRIQKLKRSGYIRERPRAVGDPSILHLAKMALLPLQGSGRVLHHVPVTPAYLHKRSRVSELTLQHELEVMDVRTAMIEAIKRVDGLSLTEFNTWPALYQFKASHTSVNLGCRELLMKPDGFIRIRKETDEGTFGSVFFLEVDRSTETQEIVAQKAACYLDHYKTGGLAVRFGADPGAFKDFPFRALMVCKNPERRNNVAERLLQNTPPILSQVWCATMSDLLADPLGPVWIRPIDYSEVISGTHFQKGVTTRRASERDRFVELHVRKRKLLS